MFFEPVLILVIFFLRTSRSAALTKSGSSRPSSTSFFLALLLTSTDFRDIPVGRIGNLGRARGTARSRIVNMPASLSFCLVTAPTPSNAGHVKIFVFYLLFF